MTTFIQFQPSQAAPFQFQGTFDDAQYNVIVNSSLFGQRYYVNIYALDGTRIVSRPLVGSRTGFQIGAIAWADGRVTVETREAHGFKVGALVALTISGNTPDAYNGVFECTIASADTFTYALASDPGQASAFGAAAYNVSLTAGYFASTMVFRQGTQTFEISP